MSILNLLEWKWDGGIVLVWENVFVLRKFMLKYLKLKWTDISGEREGDRERNRTQMRLNVNNW